jgi:triosephosphate isomerase
MARTPIIAGNWKMNKGTASEARALAAEVAAATADAMGVEVVLCPPFTVLATVVEAVHATTIGVGAQDVFWKSSGAYTSQLSAPMLVDAGARYVILGHSETRGRFGVAEPDFTETILRHFGESDASVNRKVRAAIDGGLVPIVCVGETLGEREANQTDAIVAEQVALALLGVTPEEAGALVFAYEPVWAIGTGRTCDADEADRVCGVVRAAVAAATDDSAAGAVRIQYGGSMKPDNAAVLLARPNIDGGLIGGASLKAADFAAIVAAAR